MGFTVIDDVILEADEILEPMEKLLLIYITKYHNDKKGYAFPSMKVLTKHLGYSHDRYTKNYIDSLIEKGYIRKETVKQKNRYYLLNKVQNVPNVQDVPNVQNVLDSEVQNIPNGTVQNVPTNNTNNNTNKKTNINNTKKASKKSNRKIEFDFLINEYTDNENLKEALKDFLKMRELIKSIMSERALKMLFNQLDKLADTDQAKVNILEQSIFNNWKSVYPLRRNQEQLNKEQQAIKIDRNVKADNVEDAIKLIRGEIDGR
ncbi:MAG: helix-turn-helix domain-containing protein [Peptostreptococcaceae bacterium]